MYKLNKLVAIVTVMMIALACAGSVNGQAGNRNTKRDEAFDPIEFLKRFKLGMSYTEVQAILPKDAEQDIISYITTEEVFFLSVDLPTQSNWSAAFKFDTMDTAMRRPERLVELSCSATVSSNSDSFESIVRKVTDAFGEPIQLDRSETEIKQAGWRVSGGSYLTLEYSVVPTGLSGKNVNVDFTIKKNKRRESAKSKSVA